MFIRKAIRQYKGKSYTNYVLVESVRTEKGPRQKTICSLGNLKPRSRSEWLKLAHKVEEALVGQRNLFEKEESEVRRIVQKVQSRQAKEAARAHRVSPSEAQDVGEMVTIQTDGVRTQTHREAGPVHVGYQFWKRLGLEEILEGIGFSERARKLTCAMTMNRLIHPCAEYAMPQWIHRTALSDILGMGFEGLSEDALYRNMDRLYPNRVAIESALVDRERHLFNLEPTVFLYDLTSTYFEGEAVGNPKAQRGYSRDKRPDCKQVVMGLAIGREGFPLAHEIFPGNLQDRSSLGEMLDILDRRVGLQPGQTVVVDRGMSFEDNLEEIRSRKLHYVVASRQPERDQWLAEFEEEGGFEEVIRQPSPRNPFQKKSRIRIKRVSGDDELYILCLSEGRFEKDRAIRQKQEKRLLVDLAKLAKRIRTGRLVKPDKIHQAIGRLKERYPRVARYYRIDYEEENGKLSYTLLDEKRAKAEDLDGAYLLRTDRKDLSAKEAWHIYNLLTRVENAFRNMKSPLCERPIFHQIERRVDTHIFLCVLAYHLLVAIENTLLGKGVHTSWATVRESLKTHQVCTVVLPTDKADVLRIRKGATPEPMHREIYQLLDITSEIMKPKKTWTRMNRRHCSD